MIAKIILGISILPVLLIMYTVLKGMGKEQNCSLFGVTLWSGAMETGEVQKIIKSYNKQVNCLALGILAAQVLIYLPKHFSITLLLWMLWLFAVITLIYLPYVCANKKMKKLKEQDVSLSEDDKNWIWGIFYYNKNDKRFLVPKKVGIGSTFNMAHRASVVFNIVTIALVVLVVGGSAAVLALDEFIPVELAYKDRQLVSSQWKEEYCIKKEEIASVTLLEELPGMSKSSGTEMVNLRKGNFFSREYDRRFKVCFNPQKTPVLMLETKDGTWYLLGDSESKHTEEIYQELMNDK